MKVPPLPPEKIAELQTIIELVIDAGANAKPSDEKVAETYQKHLLRLLNTQESEPPLSEEDRIFREASQKEERESRQS